MDDDFCGELVPRAEAGTPFDGLNAVTAFNFDTKHGGRFMVRGEFSPDELRALLDAQERRLNPRR